MLLLLLADIENYMCSKCKLMKHVEKKVQGLEAHLATIQLINEDEYHLNRTEEALLEMLREDSGLHMKGGRQHHARCKTEEECQPMNSACNQDFCGPGTE